MPGIMLDILHIYIFTALLRLDMYLSLFRLLYTILKHRRQVVYKQTFISPSLEGWKSKIIVRGYILVKALSWAGDCLLLCSYVLEGAWELSEDS